MSNLLKFISPAMLAVCAFCVSDASANSIPYSPDSKNTAGLPDFQSKSKSPEKPFSPLLHLTGVQQEKALLSFQGGNHGDDHSSNGNGPTGGGDQGDDAEDDTSNTPLPGSGDESGSEVEETSAPPIPPVLPSDPPGTTSPSAVPVPAAIWLFLSGIIGLGVTAVPRRR
jgi:hypothetical protein